MYDRQRVGWIEFVGSRDAPTLLPLIQRYVRPGTMIYSDGWKAYNNLPNIGYGHKRVIHADNFVDPVTGVHTNGLEAYWSRAKQKLKLFQPYPKHNDNGEQQPSLSNLGESASNFEAYVPILLRSSSSSTTTTRRAISSNCYARSPLSSMAASSSSSTTTQTSPDKGNHCQRINNEREINAIHHHSHNFYFQPLRI